MSNCNKKWEELKLWVNEKIWQFHKLTHKYKVRGTYLYLSIFKKFTKER